MKATEGDLTNLYRIFAATWLDDFHKKKEKK
jgi:hypothetical protein